MARLVNPERYREPTVVIGQLSTLEVFDGYNRAHKVITRKGCISCVLCPSGTRVLKFSMYLSCIIRELANKYLFTTCSVKILQIISLLLCSEKRPLSKPFTGSDKQVIEWAKRVCKPKIELWSYGSSSNDYYLCSHDCVKPIHWTNVWTNVN